MALQFSVAVRNGELDAVETVIGASAVLKIKTGAPPATCATADAGTVLATITLPADWMTAAAAGVKAKDGTWEDASADDSGDAGHWRLYASDGTTCHAQGTITAGGGGGDMTLSTITITATQTITINTFSLTAANA